MKHKHAELIKAWADGAEIEMKNWQGEWVKAWDNPQWKEDAEYRIKPELKPDVVQIWFADSNNFPTQRTMGEYNLKLIFDGKTGKLKNAEVL